MKKKLFSLALILLISSPASFSQGLGDVEMEQINIDGQYESYANSPQRESRSDRLKKYREKLERQNEAMIQKKIEKIRYRNEVRLMKKMQKAMSRTMKALNNVKTQP